MLRINFSGSSKNEGLRYLASGGTATLIDWVVFYLLYSVNDSNYYQAAILAFIPGIIISYVGSIFWVFQDYVRKPIKQEILIFSTICLIGFMLNMLSGAIIVETNVLANNHIDGQVAKVFASILIMIFNASTKKVLLFNKTKKVLQRSSE